MDTVRFFKDHARAQHRAARANSPSIATLQQVQHKVAVSAGYTSWQALLKASEADRKLAVVMTQHPLLCDIGMGVGRTSLWDLEERRGLLESRRVTLRASSEIVAEVADWLRANVVPIRTVNRDAAFSYSVKHIVERAMGPGMYVSNGQLIAAALIVGYPYWHEAGSSTPNVHFGMSKRSLAAVDVPR